MLAGTKAMAPGGVGMVQESAAKPEGDPTAFMDSLARHKKLLAY